MNTELLLKVKKAILAQPKRFRMDEWYTFHDSQAPCGTTGCIAGFALAINETNQLRMSKKLWTETAIKMWHTLSIQSKAARVLDINEDQAARLFHIGQWPVEFLDSYTTSTTREERAKITAERIDNFIKNEQRTIT